VEAVKLSDIELESVTPGSSQEMMDLLGMEPITSSMEIDAVKGACYQMLPSWKKGTL